MEKLPNLVRNRLQASRAADHPDPNLLNAFADQLLDRGERSLILGHLANCADCREILALAAPEPQPVAATPSPFNTLRTNGSRWLRWPMLRWASVAACVVIVGAAATLYRNLNHAPAIDPYVSGRNDAYSPPKSTDTAKANPAETAVSRLDSVGNVESKQAERAPGRAATPEEERSSDVARKSKAQYDYSASNKKDEHVVASGQLALKSGASEADEVAGANAPAPAPNAPPGIRAITPDQLSKTAGAGVTATGPTELGKLNDPKAANAKEATNETVEVQTGTQLVELQPQSLPASTISSAAKARKKSEVGNFAPGRVSTESANGLSQQNLAERAAIAPGASIMKDLVNARWTLSSEGLPQRSLDAGKTWEKMHVENLSGFRALSAAGLEVWVGGLGGLLYHTNDVGMHWNRVRPVADGSVLTADIVRIDFSDALRGKVTTADQHTWSTADGGKTWQKN